MDSSNLKKIYAKNIALVRFLFSLMVNGFTFFGIIVWKWNFFTIIYLYWAEEVIRLFFRIIENKINYLKDRISKEESQIKQKAILTMFFPMGIYFVFIIVIVGIVATPTSDAWGENILTVFFKNTEFNLNLLLAIFSEIVILIYLFNKINENKFDNQSNELIQEELENEFLRKQEEQNAKNPKTPYEALLAQNQTQEFSTQMLVLHLSIILGAFLYFAANTNKLPIQIDLGAAGEFAFVIVFAAIQTIAEVMIFVKSRKK